MGANVIRIQTFIPGTFPVVGIREEPTLRAALHAAFGTSEAPATRATHLSGVAFHEKALDAVFDHVIDCDGAPARLIVTSSGVGHLVWVTDWDSQSADRTEAALKEAAAPTIGVVCRLLDQYATALPDSGTRSLEPGTTVWFYRVIVDAADRVTIGERASGRLDRGRDLEGGGGRLAFGYATAATRKTGEAIAEAMLLAFDVWLTLVAVNDRLRGWLEEVSSVTSSDHALFGRVAKASRQVEILRARQLERMRFLHGTSRTAYDGAISVLGIGDEARAVGERMGTLRELATAHRSRLAARRDDRRDLLLFAFTVVSLLQVSLSLFDFVTGESTIVGSPVRAAVGAAFLIAAIAVIVAALLNGRSSGVEER